MNGIKIEEIRYEDFLFRTYYETIRKVEIVGKDGKKKTAMMPEHIATESRIERDKEKVREGFIDFQKFLESGIEVLEMYGPRSVRYKGDDGKIYHRFIMGFIADNQKEGGIRICDLMKRS